MSPWIFVPLGAVAAWNLLVWGVWRWDKSRAKVRGARRVPEATLVLLARLLGSGGALAAMYLHADPHKTNKPEIVRDVWFAALAHVCAVGIAVAQVA